MANAALIITVNDLLAKLHDPDEMHDALLELANMGMMPSILENTKAVEILTEIANFPCYGPLARIVLKEWIEDDAISSSSTRSETRKRISDEVTSHLPKKAKIENRENSAGHAKIATPSYSSPVDSAPSSSEKKKIDKSTLNTVAAEIGRRRKERESHKRKTKLLSNGDFTRPPLKNTSIPNTPRKTDKKKSNLVKRSKNSRK